jgi:hypothetical protein
LIFFIFLHFFKFEVGACNWTRSLGLPFLMFVTDSIARVGSRDTCPPHKVPHANTRADAKQRPSADRVAGHAFQTVVGSDGKGD